MALLDIRQRTGWLFGAIVVSHIILISAQVTTQRGVPVLQEVTFGTFAEMQRGATGSGQQRTRRLAELLRAAADPPGERAAEAGSHRAACLAAAGADAPRSRRVRCSSCSTCNRRRRFKTAAAAVIGSGADPEFRTMTIDKGTQDGLREDMAVIAPAGIVGRILMPTARAAKVQLIIDRDAGAGVHGRAFASQRCRRRAWAARYAGFPGRV